VAPILAGVDKFFHVLTDWDKYLPGVVEPPGRRPRFTALMLVVGVIEVAAGIGVAPEAAHLQLRRRGVAGGHHHQPAPHSRLFRRRASRLRPLAGGVGLGPAEP